MALSFFISLFLSFQVPLYAERSQNSETSQVKLQHNIQLLEKHRARIKESIENAVSREVSPHEGRRILEAQGLLKSPAPYDGWLIDLGPLYAREKSTKRYLKNGNGAWLLPEAISSKLRTVETLERDPNFSKGRVQTRGDVLHGMMEHAARRLDRAVRQLGDQLDPVLKMEKKYIASGEVNLSEVESQLEKAVRAYQSADEETGIPAAIQLARVAALYSTPEARRQKLCRYFEQAPGDKHTYASMLALVPKDIRHLNLNVPLIKTVDYSFQYPKPQRQQEAECVGEALAAEMTRVDRARENPYSAQYAYRFLQAFGELGLVRDNQKLSPSFHPGVRSSADVIQVASSYPIPRQSEWEKLKREFSSIESLNAVWAEWAKTSEPRGIEEHRFFLEGPMFEMRQRPASYDACMAMELEDLERIASEALSALLENEITMMAFTSSDFRTPSDLQEGWLRPLPGGEFGHAINLVGQGIDVDPFSQRPTMYIKTRDTLTPPNIFHKVAVADLLPLLQDLVVVKKVGPVAPRFAD